MFCLLVVMAVLLEPLCFSAQSGEPSTPGVIWEIERSICCVILDLSMQLPVLDFRFAVHHSIAVRTMGKVRNIYN